MSSHAQITIVGFLGSDPEMKIIPRSENEFCEFSVAVNPRRDSDIVNWYSVSVFGKQGDACDQYLRKGRQVFVTGRLEVTSGKEKDFLNVRADSVAFLGSGDGDGDGQDRGSDRGRDNDRGRGSSRGRDNDRGRDSDRDSGGRSRGGRDDSRGSRRSRDDEDRPQF